VITFRIDSHTIKRGILTHVHLLVHTFEENDCENANTRSLVGTHVVVLAHFEKEVEFEG